MPAILSRQVSLDCSTCTQHLLDEDFSGVFSPQEAALKATLLTFCDRLAANELARSSPGYAVVAETLSRLGYKNGTGIGTAPNPATPA